MREVMNRFDLDLLLTPHEDQRNFLDNGTRHRKRMRKTSSNVKAVTDSGMPRSTSAKDVRIINDSLTDDMTVLLPGQRSAPLPGYDDDRHCPLCMVRFVQDGLSVKEVKEGATLGEFLQLAQREFQDFAGRPAMDIANELLENIQSYVEQNPDCLGCLNDMSAEDVMEHFKYDHMHKNHISVREKVLRILINMLDVSLTSCCQKMENGKIVLGKQDSILVLHIIDRVHKIATLRELDAL